MCGITGIFAFNPIGRIHLIHLEAATRELSKRGPDAHGTWFDNHVGLGHRRLSIIDTSEGANQPFSDATGRYQIIFNGEIYNFRQIRDELGLKGYSFRTSGDTEVLLYSYIHWGKDCLEKLNGFFAFAIYDAGEKKLFIARDRFGIKPLYYYRDEDKVLFASEMKSLLRYQVKRRIDPLALHLYFQHTYIPSPHTILDGVHKLAQGHYMTIGSDGVRIEKYYTIPYDRTPGITDFEEAKAKLVEVMSESVERRLVADVPLGAFLSGGIDSSIIVAMASEKVSDFKTFSVGFKDQAYFDETHYARLVAEKYKTDHFEIKLTNDDLLAELQHMLDYIDEPFADSSALPLYVLSKFTRQHVKVALSGDGADELFSGYNKHSAWLLSQSGGLRSKAIAALAPIWNMLPKSRGSYLTDKFRQLDRFASLMKLSSEERYWFLASFVQEEEVRMLLKKEYQAEQSMIYQFRSGYPPIEKGALSDTLLRDSTLVLEGDMLTKVDRMSMAHALEVRVPFLDPAVVKLAFSLSDQFKAVGNSRKIILRDAFRNYLPEELYARPKHGFEVPLLPWFRKELGLQLQEKVFNRELIESQGIFEWTEVKRLQTRLSSMNPGDVHIPVWSMLVFQNWYTKYFQA